MPADARFPEPVVNIVVTRQRFEHELLRHRLIDTIDGAYSDPFADLLGQYCETDNGVAVLGDDVLRAAMAGHIRRMVIDSKGVVVDLGRRRRLFTGAARVALKLMIRHCGHVGCDIGQQSCQIDHIDEWVRDGGATDVDNGKLKCGGHNRDKHRLGLTERTDRTGKLIQYRPDGTPITPVGQRLHLDPPTRSSATDMSAGWPIHHMSLVA